MSWNPKFRVVLADPADRVAAARLARQLAAACQLQSCTATSESHALISALVAVHPVALSIELSALDTLRIPRGLLRGAARSAELEVSQSESWPILTLSAQRDHVTHFVVEPLPRMPPEALTPYVNECIALARDVGMQVPDAPTEIERGRVRIPVYGDAFSLLAPALTTRFPRSYFTLRAVVDPDDSPALVADLSPDLWGSYTFPLALDDDALLPALARCAARTGAAASVCWDDPASGLWIPYTWPDGRQQDDGRVYTVTFTDDPTGCQVLVSTVIDHCGLDNAAAWLAERAGAPVVYQPPS